MRGDAEMCSIRQLYIIHSVLDTSLNICFHYWALNAQNINVLNKWIISLPGVSTVITNMSHRKKKSLVISWIRVPFIAGRETVLYNQFSTSICVIHGSLWKWRTRFSSPFIFHFLGIQGRRLNIITSPVTSHAFWVTLSSSSGLTHFPVMRANQLTVCSSMTAAGTEDVASTISLFFTLFIQCVVERLILFPVSFAM